MGKLILAIDPGNEKSAFVVLDDNNLKTVVGGILENGDILEIIANSSCDRMAIEMVASYGMAVGKEVFETVFWIGRFYEQARANDNIVYIDRIYRKDVKMNLCNTMRAKDSNVRQALIDRFGVVGTKKNPGWFYGFKADIWSAYAVGVTYWDTVARGIEDVEIMGKGC